MTTAADVTVIGALAATWLAASLLADTPPRRRHPHALLRRIRVLTLLILLGAALLVAVPFVAATVAGKSAAPLAPSSPLCRLPPHTRSSPPPCRSPAWRR